MAYTKEIITGAGALACAIGIGFVMQSSDAAEMRYGDAPVQAELPGYEGDVMLDVQEVKLTSAEFDGMISLPDTDTAVIQASAPASLLDAPEVHEAMPETRATPTPARICDVIATARPVAAAMVDLKMEAPCLPNERITIHHNGMIVTETTSATGSISLILPALAQDAVFILAFTNGEGAVAQTLVEDIGEYNRAVLQWKGDTGFQIHAREFGAGYGEQGHLWADAPGTVAGAVVGNSGVMTRHGDMSAADPLLAEVYTFPKAHTARAGDIAISVETEVTEMNCGLEIEAQSLELQDDNTIKTRNLTLAVPVCDGKDSFLVLNNLLQDLKVAAK
jgi:hypothetical protein